MRFISCVFAAGVLAVGVASVGQAAMFQSSHPETVTEHMARGRHNSGGTAHRGSGRRRVLAVTPAPLDSIADHIA